MYVAGLSTGVPIRLDIPDYIDTLPGMKDFVKTTAQYIALAEDGYTGTTKYATVDASHVAGTITDVVHTEKAWQEGRARTPNGFDAGAQGKVMRIMFDLRTSQRVAYITFGVHT